MLQIMANFNGETALLKFIHTWCAYFDCFIRMFHEVIVLLEYIDHFQDMQTLAGKDSQPDCISLPNMLALCLILSGTYTITNATHHT